jgi:hypothetical protein
MNWRNCERWFEVMRSCGADVRALHDGHPTACVGDAQSPRQRLQGSPMSFFRGAELADPDGLLEGTGRSAPSSQAVPRGTTRTGTPIHVAYTDMKQRLGRSSSWGHRTCQVRPPSEVSSRSLRVCVRDWLASRSSRHRAHHAGRRQARERIAGASGLFLMVRAAGTPRTNGCCSALARTEVT